MKHYRSSIPKAAHERLVSTFVTSTQKYKVECVLNRKVVGVRYFHETGELALECPLKNGRLHGIEYRFDVPSRLLSAEPWVDGLQHGVARQWSDDGTLIGTYEMKRGTGIDLWWVQLSDGVPHLSEARYVKDGLRHGFEWWLNEDQGSVLEERHFWNGELHGIERHWNPGMRLRRGFPKYWVNWERASKRQYIRACAKDPSLPPFREEDNRPERKFPPEIAAHLRKRARRRRPRG
jgi:hypothetical protein